jgi:hypothetical protein
MGSEQDASAVFAYPRAARVRRHGPCGYLNHALYKPWLRDEFEFRCVYCLCRERWFPDGDDAFSVDHLDPSSLAVRPAREYENLVYACCRCNSAKRDIPGLPDPCADPYGQHVFVLSDGTIRALTDMGRDLIGICQLDRAGLTEYRRRMIDLWNSIATRDSAAVVILRRRYFGYPDALPRLFRLRPPGGNRRLKGIVESFFQRQSRNELPDFY